MKKKIVNKAKKNLKNKEDKLKKTKRNLKKSKKILTASIIILAVTVVILLIISMSKVPSSTPNFAGFSWYRNTDVDTEYIVLDKDGHFAYYYGVGSPVDDYDMCESYTYNEKTKTIKINCDGDIIGDQTIEVISYKKNTLSLKFDDGIRQFQREH